jgi:hypothetical protein
VFEKHTAHRSKSSPHIGGKESRRGPGIGGRRVGRDKVSLSLADLQQPNKSFPQSLSIERLADGVGYLDQSLIQQICNSPNL